YDKAIEHYLKAIRLKPNAVYYQNIADVYREIKNFDEAIDYYNEAIALNPKYDKAYNSLGVTYDSQKEYDKAIEYYQQAISINPGDFIYHANMGDAYRGLQKWDDAIQCYKKALEINSDDDISYNGLGIAYSRKGKYHQAIQQYTKAASLYANPNYYANIGDTYRLLSNFTEAVKYYEAAQKSAVELDPANTTFLKDIALTYNDIGVEFYSAGDHRQAIEAYKKSITIYPGDPVIQHNLYLAAEAIADYAEAEQSLRKAIELDPQNEKYARELQELQAKIS
ncbi:MAG: tetratricopeptide repeat protein, partial [Calditrichia bacterium]